MDHVLVRTGDIKGDLYVPTLTLNGVAIPQSSSVKYLANK